MSAATRTKAETPGGWRRHAALGFMAACAAAVFGRAFFLEVVDKDFLNRQGDRRHIRTVSVPGHRGAVRDRNGEPLALSAPVDSIWVLPSELLAAPDYLSAMAGLLALKPRELEKYLRARDEKQFVYLKRQIDPDEAARFLALKAPGVFAQREYRRYYPAAEVAAHVVGFTDIDGRGQEGIEATRDASLRGVPGSRRVIRDRAGHVVEDTADIKDALPGLDTELTLDLRLQYLAYRELKSAVAENHAKGGLIIVADAASGDILAIASQPGYNPNRPDDREAASLRNRAVNDSFEPGSSIKPLLIAQALETRAIGLDYRVDTGPGYFKVGARTVRDEHLTGPIDLALLLSRSSNVGAAKVGLAMGAESVWAGYQKFGIGEPVGSGMPGEAGGVLRAYSTWDPFETATASFGYGLTVNALQLVRAYCAIADDGLMPQLAILHRDSLIPPQRTVSAQTARNVRKLLEGVTEKGGTAVKAAIAGYRVAGKTGTIKKNANGSYLEGSYQSLFVGMIPAQNPRLIGLVMIDDPAAGIYFGGDVSAPVFSRVLAGAARLLQIQPDELPQMPPKTQTAAATLQTVAAIAGVRP